MGFIDKLRENKANLTELVSELAFTDKDLNQNNANNTVDINAILLYINGISPDTPKSSDSLFQIDQQMLIRLSNHCWQNDDRDNLHYNDQNKWVLSPFYERVLLFLNLSQFVTVKTQDLVSAGHLLTKYLNTLSDDMQLEIIDKITTNLHIGNGIVFACKGNFGLAVTLGLALLCKNKNDLLKRIVENLKQDDDKLPLTLFIVRAIHETGLNLSEVLGHEILSPVIHALTGQAEFKEKRELLQFLYASLGYKVDNFDAAFLCYEHNYKRILAPSGKDHEFQTKLIYFFMGEKIDALAREKVQGTNGLVLTVKSDELNLALKNNDKKTIKLLLLAGANIETIKESELTRLHSNELQSSDNPEQSLEGLLSQLTEQSEEQILKLLSNGASAKHISLQYVFNEIKFSPTYHFTFLLPLIKAGAIYSESVIWTVLDKDYGNALYILINNKNIDAAKFTDHEHVPLIMRAVISGKEESVKALLKTGVNIKQTYNLSNSFSSELYSYAKFLEEHKHIRVATTLVAAVDLGKSNLVRLLLAHGASLEDHYLYSHSTYNALDVAEFNVNNPNPNYSQILKLLKYWKEMQIIVNQAKPSANIISILELFKQHHKTTASKFSYQSSSKTNLSEALIKANELIKICCKDSSSQSIINLVITQTITYSKLSSLEDDEENLLATLKFLSRNDSIKFLSNELPKEVISKYREDEVNDHNSNSVQLVQM